MQNDEEARLAQQAAIEKDRRRRLGWVTALLMLGLPIYLLAASWIVSLLTAPQVGADGALLEGKPVHWLIELGVYVLLGLVWAFPLKRLVSGLGKRRSSA